MSAPRLHDCRLPDPWLDGGVGPPAFMEWRCPNRNCGQLWSLDIDYARATDGDEFEVRTWERVVPRSVAVDSGHRSATPEVDPWLDES